MAQLTMQQIQEIVGGKWVVAPQDETATIQHYGLYGGEIRRDIGANNLLFAMSLEHWQHGSGNSGVYLHTFKDNHDRVAALQDYLKMAIVERPVPTSSVPQLQVPDAYQAMEKLVRVIQPAYQGKNIGVTGSVGKSTTKTLIAYLLQHLGPTVSSVGNHNSRTSGKIQALNVEQSQYNVLELAAMALNYQEPGQDRIGIAALIAFDLAVLTQVDAGQKGWDARLTADVKTRMGASLKPGAPFLVNSAIHNLDEVTDFVHRYTQNLVTYGLTPDSDYAGQLDAHGQLTLVHRGIRLGQLDATGLDEGMVSDMVGALAAYHLLGGQLTPAILLDFSEKCAQTSTRKVHHFVANGHQITIVDDTHNAELLSIKNFIHYAQHYQVTPHTKKLFIEGRVINLRKISVKTHTEVTQLLNQANFDQFYTYGPEMDWVIPAADFASYGGYFTTPRAVTRAIAQTADQDLVIFIKGDSRNSSIDRIADNLMANLDYEATPASAFAMSIGEPQPQAYSRNGVGRLLIILKVMEELAAGKLQLTDALTITNPMPKDHSRHKVGLAKGAAYTVFDLLTIAIVASAPDVITNLAEHLYGRHGRQIVQALQRHAAQLGLSDQTVANVTGRPTKRPQRTYLADLEKIGEAFTRLPNGVFSLLSAQQIMVNGHFYHKRSQLFKTGKIAGSLFNDWQEQSGLFFTQDQQGKHAVAFINSPHLSTTDALMADWVDAQADSAQLIPANTTVALQTPVINLLADTYFGEDYTRRREHRGQPDALQKYGYGHSFEKIGKFFSPTAYNLFNFEAVFAQGASPLDAVKPFVLDARAQPTLAELQRHHFDLAMLGNNHANDYGPAALTDTLAAFHDAGIATVGGGVDRTDARRVVTLDYDGQQVALFNGYWYRNPAENLFDFYARANRAGVACLDTLMAQDIRRYKQAHPSALVLVSAHWGTDYGDVKPAQRETAHRLVQAGADIIIGHGPHRLQPITYIGAAPVLYSIGNGVFNNNGEFKKRDVPPYAAIVRLNLAERRLYWCPIYADNRQTFWQPDFVSADDFAQIVATDGPKFATTQLEDGISAVVIPF
ncbi:MAG: CapA family protein [Levilactobacillus sp.]|uniref:CapA family protein n=1 Tax=Levilactobacillus sp. TaxID=2767919 RepID=UPI00258EC835|nr:CapA family protein [Levilactobacillus sp.]MCH4123102.1 CapA family protein [Levilactobacillus sp.]MCI1552760.1 CapA family protein [Levilactobacillus sp.]MCI1599586.1 CapA family protein [Levilactobacillus sp.]